MESRNPGFWLWDPNLGVRTPKITILDPFLDPFWEGRDRLRDNMPPNPDFGPPGVVENRSF